MIEQPVGAALSHELYVKGEQVDGDLDNLIERRHHRRVKDEGDRVVEAAWKETERAYQEKRRQRARLEWQCPSCRPGLSPPPHPGRSDRAPRAGSREVRRPTVRSSIMATDPQAILQERNAEVEKINGFVDLTREAKDRRIAEVNERANAQYAEAREAEQRGREERLASATKAVFGVPTAASYNDAEVAQVYAAFRGAWSEVQIATADPVRAQEELGQILDQAERTGDTLLARAAYHRAIDLGAQEIVDRYLAERPGAAKAWQKYTEATEEVSQASGIEHMLAGALMERTLAG